MATITCANCGRPGVRNAARGECHACYVWRKEKGEPRPAALLPPTRTERPPGLHSTSEVIAATGITARQLSYWCTQGYVRPTMGHEGSGFHRSFSTYQVDALARVKARIDWGMTPEAAFRCADPHLPPPPLRGILGTEVASEVRDG